MNGLEQMMILPITERARTMILDAEAPLEFWGEAVNTAVYLYQRIPNEGLTSRDNHDGHKSPYDTPYEMPHSHALAKTCMISSCVHDSTTLWRIWDPEHNTVKAQSNVIFDKQRNTYISCPQSPKRKQGVHDDKPKETTEIDIFGRLQDETHIEQIDIATSGTDESISHGRTQGTNGMGESMSHGRTDEVARLPVAGNPTAAGANSDLPLSGNSTNGHGDRSPPASGERDGHTHTYGS